MTRHVLLPAIGCPIAAAVTIGTPQGVAALQAVGGTIEGHVRLMGAAPANSIIRMRGSALLEDARALRSIDANG